MAVFRHEQRRLTHRGRDFHFVSYEAHRPNPARHELAMPDTWYLVSSGNRWPAIPYVLAQPMAELDAALVAWLEAVVFASPGASQAAQA